MTGYTTVKLSLYNKSTLLEDILKNSSMQIFSVLFGVVEEPRPLEATTKNSLEIKTTSF